MKIAINRTTPDTNRPKITVDIENGTPKEIQETLMLALELDGYAKGDILMVFNLQEVETQKADSQDVVDETPARFTEDDMIGFAAHCTFFNVEATKKTLRDYLEIRMFMTREPLQ